MSFGQSKANLGFTYGSFIYLPSDLSQLIKASELCFFLEKRDFLLQDSCGNKLKTMHIKAFTHCLACNKHSINVL